MEIPWYILSAIITVSNLKVLYEFYKENVRNHNLNFHHKFFFSFLASSASNIIRQKVYILAEEGMK